MNDRADSRHARLALHEAAHVTPARGTFESPFKQGRAKVLWPYVATVAGVHLLALLSLVPWLFSWTGVVVCIVAGLLFGIVGINIGYHRMLSHRSFKCPKWFERTLAVMGLCSLQGPPARWIVLHRMHHQYSDEEQDPHTPLVSFLWAHFEWIFSEHKDRNWFVLYDKYAPDIIRDRFYRSLERSAKWYAVYSLHAFAFFVIGFAGGWLFPGGSLREGLQLGASVLVWGVFVRTVHVWHVTWSVNSLTHVLGYRNYETPDQSRNNWLVGIFAGGEGWHNNHHAEPNSAAAGHRWWEFDLSYQIIRALALVGLVHDIVPVRGHAPHARGKDSRPVVAVVHADGSRVLTEQMPGTADSQPDATRRAA